MFLPPDGIDMPSCACEALQGRAIASMEPLPQKQVGAQFKWPANCLIPYPFQIMVPQSNWGPQMAQKRQDFKATAAATIFVDREAPKQTFDDAAKAIPDEGCVIRTWYGVGGQGKTALARELFRIASSDENPGYAHLKCGMVDLHGRPLTDPDIFLVWIRNAFAKSGIGFPAFDLAFAIMWERTRGEQPMPVLDSPWIRRSSEAISENAGDVVALTREFISDQAHTIPVLGFLLKKGSKWAFDRAKQAWIEKARPYLSVLYEGSELIEGHEMTSRMPWLLAQDLNAWRKANPEKRLVLFIDEYERIHDGAGTGATWQENRIDGCLRTLLSETDGLLALFFSRERLPWEEEADWRAELAGNQHLLGGLSDKDAEAWLLKVPVADAAIRTAMIQGARETTAPGAPVYPLMLDLQVEHWRNLGTKARPENFAVEETAFEARRHSLVRRLLRDYPDPVQEVLSRLAVASRFDEEAFDHVVAEFRLPVPSSMFDRLSRLSLVTVAEDGWLSLHRAIADAIVESSDPEDVAESRAVLREHLSIRANPEDIRAVNATTLACFQEAARLRLAEGSEGYDVWLAETDTALREAGAFHRYLLDYWKEAVAFLRSDAAEPKGDLGYALNSVAYHLSGLGRYREAEISYRDAYSAWEAAALFEPELEAMALASIGSALNDQGRHVEAEDYLRRALEMRKENFDNNDPNFGSNYNSIGVALDGQGRHVEAEDCYRRALEIRRAVLGDDHPDVGSSYNNIGAALNGQERYAEAEVYYRRALDISRRALGDDHPVVGTSYNNIGAALSDQGQHADAEDYFRRALDISRRALGDDHPDVGTRYSNVGAALSSQGRLAEAEHYYRRALDIRLMTLGNDHPDVGTSLLNMGSVIDEMDRLEEAEAFYRQATVIFEKRRLEDPASWVSAMNNLGYNLNCQGRYAEAELYLRQALLVDYGSTDQDRLKVANNLANIADSLLGQKRLFEAEVCLRQSLDIRTQHLSADDALVGHSHYGLGMCLQELDRFVEAEPHLREAVRIRTHCFSDGASLTGVSLHALGGNLIEQRRFSEAEPILRRALEIAISENGERDSGTANTMNYLGNCLVGIGNLSEAAVHFRNAFEIWSLNDKDEAEQMAANHLWFAKSMRSVSKIEEARDHATIARNSLVALKGTEDTEALEATSLLQELAASTE